MKVILREEVEKLGDAGQIVDVTDGYARNYLLARRLALVATKENEQRVQAQMRRRAVSERERIESLRAMASRLNGCSITIAARANEEQKLFGSVGADEIAASLASEHDARIEREQVALKEPIRDLGVFDVKLSLAPDIGADIKVWVVQED